MADLIILINSDIHAPWDWCVGNAHGQAVSSQQKSELASKTYNKIIVVMPGMDVLTKRHELVGLNKKQLVQAAGFHMEDELAVSLEATHLAFDENTNRIAIIAKSKLKNAIAELELAGLYPDVICADYDSFQADESHLVEGRLVTSGSDGLGQSIEKELANEFMSANENLPSPVTSAQFLQKISKAYVSGHRAINLRQGEFSKQTSFANGRLKRSIWLAVACAVLFVGFNLGQGLFFKQKAKAVNAQISEIYSQIFPGTDTPKNLVLSVLKAQAERKSTGGETFIQLSSILARSINDVEGVELVSLGYDKGRAHISLSIIYNSFDDVEKLKAAVARNGGSFLESGTRQSNSGLVGDAILKVAS